MGSRWRQEPSMPPPFQILVVEDYPPMLAWLTRCLGRAGYDVTGVTTVQGAIAAVTAQAPDRVLTDLHLPTGDGMELLAYLPTHYPQANIIVMTGFASEATRQQALARGTHA
jgi:CheY-like chemotaxis protein